MINAFELVLIVHANSEGFQPGTTKSSRYLASYQRLRFAQEEGSELMGLLSKSPGENREFQRQASQTILQMFRLWQGWRRVQFRYGDRWLPVSGSSQDRRR